MIYVIRHGKTDMNAQHKYNCRIDEDINAAGILQAENLSKEVAKLKIDVAFCSPLLRARHTLDLLNLRDVPTIIDERIIEREGGKLTGTVVDPEFYDSEYYNLDSKPQIEGLEPVQSILDRVSDFLNEIKTKYEGKNVLIVTHGGVVKAIRCYFEGIPESRNLAHLTFENCSIIKYDF